MYWQTQMCVCTSHLGDASHVTCLAISYMMLLAKIAVVHLNLLVVYKILLIFCFLGQL